MLLYDARDSILEITEAGNVKLPRSAWGQSYEFAAAHVYFFVKVLQNIQGRCPMALVDLHYLCWKGRMPIAVPKVELQAMVAIVPLIALSATKEWVLNVGDPQIARFLLDAIIIEGFTAHLNPAIIDAAKHIEWRREEFPQLASLGQITA